MKKPTIKLTNRDVALMLDIYKHRYLTVGQMQQLHFPSLQTAYRRSRLLKSSGYVLVFRVANIDEGIVALTSKGLDIVAGALGVQRSELKWNEATATPKDYYFMRHFVAINNFRIALRQACSESGIMLRGFIPDYYGGKTDKGGVAKYIRDVICDIGGDREQVSHTPDGVFALEKKGKVALFFLEIDRGTEVVGDPKRGVLKSLRFYISYLVDGKYQRYAKDFGVAEFKGFRALYVTPSTVRLQNIREATADIEGSPKAKRFLWITTENRISPTTILSSIWQSIDNDDALTYTIG